MKQTDFSIKFSDASVNKNMGRVLILKIFHLPWIDDYLMKWFPHPLLWNICEK